MSTFQFDLVSPERLQFSKPVTMVTVPGGEGDYGVLAGHAPLITTLRPGVIEIYQNDDKTITERIFVAGGFAEVTGDRCTVLAEEAVPVIELDRNKVEAQLRDLGESAPDAHDDATRIVFDAQMEIARAKLNALTAAA